MLQPGFSKPVGGEMVVFSTGEFFVGVTELLFRFWKGIREVRWTEVFGVAQESFFSEGGGEYY